MSGNMCCYTLKYLLMQNNRPVVKVKEIHLKQYDAKISHDSTLGLRSNRTHFEDCTFAWDQTKRRRIAFSWL